MGPDASEPSSLSPTIAEGSRVSRRPHSTTEPYARQGERELVQILPLRTLPDASLSLHNIRFMGRAIRRASPGRRRECVLRSALERYESSHDPSSVNELRVGQVTGLTTAGGTSETRLGRSEAGR